jgi:hypothetical protein
MTVAFRRSSFVRRHAAFWLICLFTVPVAAGQSPKKPSTSSKTDMQRQDATPEAVAVEDRNAHAAAAVQGRREAETDFKEKKYRFLTYGLRSAIPSKYELYLAETYKIAFEPVAGCLADAAARGRADGYNARMKTLLIELHKKDIFKEAEAHARTDRTNPLERMQ